MRKFTISDRELRDPKREWCDAENVDILLSAWESRCNEAMSVIEELKQRIAELERKLKDATAKV